MHTSRFARSLSVTTTLVLVALILLFTGSSAWATYPGQNGRIAYVANPTGTDQIYTMNPDGSDIRQITHFAIDTVLGCQISRRTDGGSSSFTT